MKNPFNDNRIVKLLLLFRKHHTWSINALAEKLAVSERTIRNDIRQLEQSLAGCAVIVSEQGQYTLNIFHEERFRAVSAKLLDNGSFADSPNGRMDYMFVRLMRAAAPLLTDDLAYEMHVGRTTLIGDLKKLREKLLPYQISIEGKTSKGLVLCGFEGDIRRYILDNNYSSFYQDYPLDGEIVEAMAEILRESSFDQGTQDAFRQFMTVMLDRFMTGHSLSHFPDSYYRLTDRAEFAIVQRILERVEELYQVTLPMEEKIFVFLPILGMRTPADISNLSDIALDGSIEPLLEKIIGRIKSEMEFSVQAEDFRGEFLYHLMFMLNRLRFHIKLQNPFLDELRGKYPLAWCMAEIAADTIQEELGLNVSEDELGYLAAYFGIFVEEYGDGQKDSYRVAVVCGTGRVTARLVAAQLRKVLDSSSEMDLFAADKVNGAILDQYDIVLLTVDLPCQCRRPIIRIREIFNEQELRRKIDKAKYWEHIEVPVLDSNRFLMANLLDENRFFLLHGVASYEEAVAKMAEGLRANGLVDADFLARLRQREKGGSMVFDHGVAIPHTVQTAVDKLVLALGVLPKPFQHQGHEMKLIFMLGLPEQLTSDDGLVLRLYDEIITIAQDAELRGEIAAATSLTELRKALYR